MEWGLETLAIRHDPSRRASFSRAAMRHEITRVVAHAAWARPRAAAAAAAAAATAAARSLDLGLALGGELSRGRWGNLAPLNPESAAVKENPLLCRVGLHV